MLDEFPRIYNLKIGEYEIFLEEKYKILDRGIWFVSIFNSGILNSTIY